MDEDFTAIGVCLLFSLIAAALAACLFAFLVKQGKNFFHVEKWLKMAFFSVEKVDFEKKRQEIFYDLANLLVLLDLKSADLAHIGVYVNLRRCISYFLGGASEAQRLP